MKTVVLITGASSGLGSYLANYLSGHGYCVYAGDRKSENDHLSTDLLHYVRLDVTSDLDCQNAVKTILKEQGRLDVVINNAGVTLKGSSMDYTSDEFIKLLDTNLVGAFRMTKAAHDSLQKSKGRLINVTSINGFVSMPNFGLYCASKHALEALGLALKHELSPEIMVTNLAPGAIIKSTDTKAASNQGKTKTAREKFPILNYLLPMSNEVQFAAATLKLIESDNPPAHLLVGVDAWVLYNLEKVLPSTLFNKLMSIVWHRK